jgi:cysteinyl-tRNA synthetase
MMIVGCGGGSGSATPADDASGATDADTRPLDGATAGDDAASAADVGATSDAVPADVGGEAGPGDVAADVAPDGGSSARGFPADAPWLSFYGNASQLGDLGMAASTFRIINLDADPGAGNFTPAQITTLKSGGKNRVISYFDVGSCENYRDWWSFSGITPPAGFVSCKDNAKAQRGAYGGYPNEVWMDVGDPDYQHLLVDWVAPRLMATGIDGFFLDNLEIVEHGATASEGPCDAACAQGGLDLVWMLRQKFPDALIVMQNATSDVTRNGMTHGVAYPSLLDGISHEEVFAPTPDTGAQAELTAWKSLALAPGGHPFFIGTEDYVGSCTNTSAAKSAYDQSRAMGFSPYATDASASQTVACYWPF